MSNSRYLTAKEAARELGISVTTLYAYVSRGLIQSEVEGGKKRTRRYRREDVETLKAKKAARRNPALVAETALNWGTPVLESAITLIEDDRFYYRGRNAIALAQTQSVEAVAELIWTGQLPEAETDLFAATPDDWPGNWLALYKQLPPVSSFEAFQIILPLVAAASPAGYALHPVAVAQTGAAILKLMALLAIGGQNLNLPLAEMLRQGWGIKKQKAESLLCMALILCADHELNVSSFTARCVASAGSTPFAVVSAGLAALQGTKHGGFTGRVEALFREVAEPAQARVVLLDRLKRGEEIPGFGHTLYPNGDPRGKALLERTLAAYPNSAGGELAQAIQNEVFDLVGLYPTIDFGLVTLGKILNLPAGTALTLFAIGRTIGWIGHAIEQYQLDHLIRPRAKYVGQMPAG